MQPREVEHRSAFPNLALLRSSAADFGLDSTGAAADAVCLSAIFGAALSFGAEAEAGAFKSIFLAYSQGLQRVYVSVAREVGDGFRMVIERIELAERNRYEAGLIATSRAVDGAWNVEATHVAGKQATVTEFLDSISELRALSLTAKEVSELPMEAEA